MRSYVKCGLVVVVVAAVGAGQLAQAVTVDSFGVTLPRDGGFVGDGGDDQFDPSNGLTVNGSPYLGGASGALPNFTIGQENVGGIDVTARMDLLVANGTTSANTVAPGLADFVYARQFYNFTNPGAVAANVSIQFEYDLGSDSDTVVHWTSSGDSVIAAGDIWSVTDDGVDGGPATGLTSSDPAVGLLVADGMTLLPTSFNLQPPADIVVDFTLALDPGESASLMLFVASRNETDIFSQTASRSQSQQDILALLADSDLLFSGLSDAAAASVVNFSYPLPTNTPTATSTSTATATPTNTPAPDGAPCVGPLDCVSGNCVADICCDQPCTGGTQRCDLPDSAGTCVDLPAGAPTISGAAKLIGLVILTVVAAVALRRRREHFTK